MFFLLLFKELLIAEGKLKTGKGFKILQSVSIQQVKFFVNCYKQMVICGKRNAYDVEIHLNNIKKCFQNC